MSTAEQQQLQDEHDDYDLVKEEQAQLLASSLSYGSDPDGVPLTSCARAARKCYLADARKTLRDLYLQSRGYDVDMNGNDTLQLPEWDNSDAFSENQQSCRRLRNAMVVLSVTIAIIALGNMGTLTNALKPMLDDYFLLMEE